MEIDRWHAYAQEVVHSTTRKWVLASNRDKAPRILNAGSGGSDYGIALPMVHLDLVAARIDGIPNAIVGDVDSIPTSGNMFDIILCVGSVLNYSNPIATIREFYRVLKPGGTLILEYERSGSPDYWLQHGLSAPCVRTTTFYGKVSTQLWAYGDQFIDNLLNNNNFKRLNELRFHGISSAALAVTKSPRLSSYFTVADHYLANLWPIRHLASNRILAVEKLAH